MVASPSGEIPALWKPVQGPCLPESVTPRGKPPPPSDRQTALYLLACSSAVRSTHCAIMRNASEKDQKSLIFPSLLENITVYNFRVFFQTFICVYL